MLRSVLTSGTRYCLLRNAKSNFSTCGVLSEKAQAGAPDRLYGMVELEIKSHDPAVLKSYEDFALMAAGHLSIPLKNKWVPDKQRIQRSLLKSVHIYKKHQVQYEFRTYFRVMQFEKLTGSTADTFLEYIERNLPEGVLMQVTRRELEALPEGVPHALS